MQSTYSGPVNAFWTAVAKAIVPSLIMLAELRDRRAA